MENNEKEEFLFSIITSVYNTQDYLNDCIDSVITQTIDFEQYVQLILVDDGSTDNSLEIALDYQRKYPSNIEVVSQENQGVGAARNTGLEYVKGKYVNFLDSDDILSEDTLQQVKEFFDRYSDITDVVSIKVTEFDRRNKQHPLNFKFEKTRVINLLDEPANPQLSVASAFINVDALKNLNFKTNLVSSSDTNLMTKVLLNKKTLGVLSSPTYFYRKRTDTNTSIVDSSLSKKGFFTARLKDHYLDVINYCLEKEGEVPLFIQHTLAYSIQWIIIPEIPEFFTPEEKEEFICCFNKVMSYLSVESLLDKKIVINNFVRNYLITKSNNDCHNIVDLENNNVFIKSKDMQLDKLSGHKLWIDNVEFNQDSITITSSFNSMFNSKNLLFEAVAEDINGNIETFISKPSKNYSRDNISFLSEVFQYINCFDLEIPLKNDINNIKITISYKENEQVITQFATIGLKKDSKLNRQYPYLIKDSNIIFFYDNVFYIRDCGVLLDKLLKNNLTKLEILLKK